MTAVDSEPLISFKALGHQKINISQAFTGKMIGAIRARERCTLRLVDPPAAALDQAVAVQDRIHGTDGRALHLGVLATQPLSDFS